LRDKLYQGSRNFSEQHFRFPWHKMKFTINWLLCSYRSNQYRSWTILHSHLSYWWTVILSNWKNGKKHAQHNKKQGPHSLFLQTGNLPSSSCVSIRIFNLTSQIAVDCVVAWATRRSLHGVGFHRIEDHGVTLLTVASWRGEMVSIKYISAFLWKLQMTLKHQNGTYNLHPQKGTESLHPQKSQQSQDHLVLSQRYVSVPTIFLLGVGEDWDLISWWNIVLNNRY
jgi:hypothetical protein